MIPSFSSQKEGGDKSLDGSPEAGLTGPGTAPKKRYEARLTYSELLMLDGKVSESAQAVIDLAKREASFGFSLPVLNEILRKSEETGKLEWRFKSINSCPYCDKVRGYAKHTRNGRYHRKGESDHNRPLSYSGVAFNEGFVTFQGWGDMCRDCFQQKNILGQLIDCILERDLKIQIQKNDYRPTRYLKDEIRICFKCDQEMQESTMGRSRTLFGDGWYPSTCPKCHTESVFLGPSHKVTNKFVMIRASSEASNASAAKPPQDPTPHPERKA